MSISRLRILRHPTIGRLHSPTQNTIASRTALIARHFDSSAILHNKAVLEEEGSTGTKQNMPSPYSLRKVGQPNTLDYRVFVEKDGVPLSWFHDIPLYANEQHTLLNMIVEIPRWTNAKLEVGEPYYTLSDGD